MRRFETRFSDEGYSLIAGVDEAGRGPLAGPVIAAAVILPDGFVGAEITDSKKLSPKKRDLLCREIMAGAVSVGIGRVDAGEIDRINILQASLEAMKQAVLKLRPAPQFLLIDGKFGISLDIPQEPIVKGDSRSISIAAASIVAKVTRDAIMAKYHARYPVYGFDRHKGYPTRFHQTAIQTHGPCPIHRKTFKRVREFVE